MVYIPPASMKSSIRGPCEKIPRTKRPISIGANVEQKPWKPTTRTGRIAADHILGKPSYRSLPPFLGPHVVDSKKKSAPAYSLGRKLTRRINFLEDGPAKFNVAGLCNKGVQSAPAYSLRSRKDEIKRFQAPPSSKYTIDKALKATTKTIPSFSFGKKPTVMKQAATPASNVYNLPPVFGTAKEGKIKAAPAFTMLGRLKARHIPAFSQPGPGDYENNYRYIQQKSPRFSLGTKHKVISDDHMKPGPAAHCPESYIKHKSVPAPSFSILHTPHLGVRKGYIIPECKIASKPDWIL